MSHPERVARTSGPMRIVQLLALLYMAMLFLAAWPSPTTPGLGFASRVSVWLLERASLVAGVTVFEAAPEDQMLRALCHRFEATLADGTSVTLIDPECPPVGLQVRRDPMRQTIHHMFTTIADADALFDRSRMAASPELFRRMAWTGDYLCHSPRVDAQPRSQVRLRRTQYWQRYSDGVRGGVENEFVCVWTCGTPEAALPQCGYVAAGGGRG